MITIKLKPSFHNFSLVTLNENYIEYEILPRLQDLRGLDIKEKLSTAEYLELKKIKSFNLNAEQQRYKEKKNVKRNLQFLKVEIEESIKSLKDQKLMKE